MPPFTLFTGENTFALREEWRRWTHTFRSKHGEENFSVFDAADTSFRQLLDDVAIAPFIAEKRLVAVRGIPKGTTEELERLPAVIHPDVVLLFAEAKLDRRLGVVKRLVAMAEVKQFMRLSGEALLAWMQVYTSTAGGTLTPGAAQLLKELVGEDQMLLARELEKLVLFAGVDSVQEQHVRALVFCTGERQVWGLLDFIGQNDAAGAFAYLTRLLEQGESPFGLWNIFLWMVTSLVTVAAAAERGVVQPSHVAKQAGVSFGSARTLLPIARRLGRDGIRELVRRVTEFDLGLKTGIYHASDGDAGELLVLLDRSLLACCVPTAR